jgi:hypothetical protein
MELSLADDLRPTCRKFDAVSLVVEVLGDYVAVEEIKAFAEDVFAAGLPGNLTIERNPRDVKFAMDDQTTLLRRPIDSEARNAIDLLMPHHHQVWNRQTAQGVPDGQ